MAALAEAVNDKGCTGMHTLRVGDSGGCGFTYEGLAEL